jgi:hypothetical protein
MFVLDVTGSMSCPTTTTNSDCSLVEAGNSKIGALRSAVVSFYTTLDTAISDDARLRFGFVPYSTTVNVGKALYAESPSYLKTNWSYQSRKRELAGWTTGTTTSGPWPGSSATNPPWSSYSQWDLHSSTTVTGSSACVAPATVYSASSVTSGAPTTSAPNATTGAVTVTTPKSRVVTETSYQRIYTSSNKNCRIEKRTRTRTETSSDTRTDTPDYDWAYTLVDIPASVLSLFKAGSTVSLDVGNATGDGPGQSESFTWDGCIEERATLPNSTFSTIPAAAYDLDIDLIPGTNEATRWAPAWKEIIWRRSSTSSDAPDRGTATVTSGNGDSNPSKGIQRMKDISSGTDRNSYVCPKEAQRLKVMTKSQVETYVSAASGFKARGFTYHDVGMIWGARFISPDGIFKNDNKEVPSGEVGAGKPINRHIIFMTDGQMDTQTTAYGLYGLEGLDRRVNTGSRPTSVDANDSRHNSRFAAICEAAKAKNITVWVVAYASSLSTPLTSCASPGKAFTAANDAQLRQQFETIASKIAELRVSK